jgi:hypothetical protein
MAVATGPMPRISSSEPDLIQRHGQALGITAGLEDQSKSCRFHCVTSPSSTCLSACPPRRRGRAGRRGPSPRRHVAGPADYHHGLDAAGPGLLIGYSKAREHQIAEGVARPAVAYRATRTADAIADPPPG